MSIDETVVTVVDLEPSRNDDIRSQADPTSNAPRAVLEGSLLVAVGLATLAAESVARAVVAALGEPSPSGEDAVEEEEEEGGAGPDRPDTISLIAGAGLDLALDATRFFTRIVAGLDRTIRPLSLVAMIPPVDRAARGLERSAIRMNAEWRHERLESQRAAEAFVDALVPRLVDVMIDRLDLTELVLERVDLDRVAGSVAIGRLVERVDPMTIVDRLDVNSVAARVDVEQIVGRLDLVAIARGVIDQLDLPEIIRGSTETMTAETRDGVRVQGMRADRFVSRLVDRALLRQDGSSGHASDAAGSTEDPP